MPLSRSQWIPMLSLTLASMLWATSFVVMKAAMADYHPYMLVFGRMLVATLLFLPFFHRHRAQWVLKPGSLKILIFMGVCEPCLYFLLEVAALRYTTASQAGMVTAMLPLLVAVGAFIVLKEEMSFPLMAGFVLAVAGVCWLSLAGRSSEAAPNPLLGNFLEFLAMVCATGYILSAKRLTTGYGYSPFMITAVQAVIGSIFFLPLLMLPGVDVAAHWQPGFWWAVLYLGAFITLGAYGLYNYGISRVPAGQAAVFINLIPVFSVFFGWLFLNERFTGQQFAAAFLILLGITLTQGPRPRRKGDGPVPNPTPGG